MTQLVGKTVTAKDAAGNAKITNSGDVGMNAAGQWIAIHPKSGLPVAITQNNIIQHVDGFITTDLMQIKDVQGNVLNCQIIHGVWNY